MTNDKNNIDKTTLNKKSDVLVPHTISDVRASLQHTIDTMGPHSPFIQSKTDDDASCSICISDFTIESESKNKLIHNKEDLIKVLDESDLTGDEVSETEMNDVSVQANNISPIFNTSNVQPVCPYIHLLDNNSFYKPNRLSRFANFVQNKFNQRNFSQKSPEMMELYKINVQEASKDGSPPRKLTFELINDLPKVDVKNISTNTKRQNKGHFIHCNTMYTDLPNNNQFYQAMNSNGFHISPEKNNGSFINFDRSDYYKIGKKDPRDDIYYFDHGNAEYFQTTDSPPSVETEILVGHTEKYTSLFWAQIFGIIHIGVAFVITFFIQLLRFLLHAIIRPLFIGVIKMNSDYFLKPCLTITFNGVIQPCLIFMFNIMTSIRDITKPVAESFGYFIKEIAVMCRAIRLVHVEKKSVST